MDHVNTQGIRLLRIPINLDLLVPTLILFISLSYVFFTTLLYIREQIMRIIYSTQTLQGTNWIRGVSAVTYILSCFLMITKLEALILYDGIFIAIYAASVLGNLASLWFITRSKVKYMNKLNALAYDDHLDAYSTLDYRFDEGFMKIIFYIILA